MGTFTDASDLEIDLIMIQENMTLVAKKINVISDTFDDDYVKNMFSHSNNFFDFKPAVGFDELKII